MSYRHGVKRMKSGGSTTATTIWWFMSIARSSICHKKARDALSPCNVADYLQKGYGSYRSSDDDDDALRASDSLLVGSCSVVPVFKNKERKHVLFIVSPSRGVAPMSESSQAPFVAQNQKTASPVS